MSEAVGNDLKGVRGCVSARSDSAVKLVGFYSRRGEERPPFCIFTTNSSHNKSVLVKDFYT